MVKKYRKKQIEVEAIQYDGTQQGVNEIFAWRLRNGSQSNVFHAEDNGDGSPHGLFIDTLEGVMKVNPGDWVVLGAVGEMYPCKPDAFEATFETGARIATSAIIADNSDAFRQFLREQGIDHTPYGEYTKVPIEIGVDIFKLGEKWAHYKTAHQPA